MSRSYKKTPWCGDKKGKSKKKIANHVVRRSLERDFNLNVQGGNYKKLYETWDICDYGWTCTWEEYWRNEWKWYYWEIEKYPHRNPQEPDKKECYRKWLKYYHNK